VLTSIARAYAELHQRGVLHGDVHPGNLLIGLQQSITLIDFGLARPIAPLRLAGRAPHGAVLEHIAPEQATVSRQGGDLPAATAASEQYALGVLLYRLATGYLPLRASLDRATMIDRICEGEILSFTRHAILPWPPLEAVLRRMMHRDPSRRFTSMREVLAALEVIRAAQADPVTPQRRRAQPDLFDTVIRQFERRVACDGTAFRRSGRAPHGSLMLGRTGTAYALYRIALVRSDPELLSLADLWLSRVEQEVAAPDAFESPEDGLERAGLGLASPYHTELGVATTRALVAIAMGDHPALQRATRQLCLDGCQRWPSRDLTLGRAGIPLAMATVLDALPAALDQYRPELEQCGRATLDGLWQELERLGPIGAPARCSTPWGPAGRR
jgi:serine/threonine-protein kinase